MDNQEDWASAFAEAQQTTRLRPPQENTKTLKTIGQGLGRIAWWIAGSLALWVFWRVPCLLGVLWLWTKLPHPNIPLAEYTAAHVLTIIGIGGLVIAFLRSFDRD